MTINCKCGTSFTDYYPGRVVALTDPTANLRECAKCGAECCTVCAPRTCEGCCEVICEACTVVVDGDPCCAACAADAMTGVAA